LNACTAFIFAAVEGHTKNVDAVTEVKRRGERGIGGGRGVGSPSVTFILTRGIALAL
jgi:hypothetical protein